MLRVPNGQKHLLLNGIGDAERQSKPAGTVSIVRVRPTAPTQIPIANNAASRKHRFS
jgi:hypothetical protein